MKYGNLTWGQMEAVVNKLGGEEGVRQFLAGETVVKMAEKNFTPFMTINLGTGLKNGADFGKALTDAGCRLSNWAKDILSQPGFTVVTEPTTVDLVVVSVAELGFKKGATYAQICERAKEYGLALCPAEVGPQLRLQYKDQPEGEWLRVAMEPITDSDGDLRLFRVGHGVGGLWLDSDYGNPDHFWNGDNRFVFAARK